MRSLVLVRPDGGFAARTPSPLTAFLVWLVLLATALGGCTARLAPAYDRTIVDGLAKINEEAMTLFASAEAPGGTFAKRQDAYNSVQGKLDALLVQVQARGTPTPPLGSATLLGAAGVPNAEQKANELLQPPTAATIQAMLRIVKTMRNDDSRGKLSVFALPLLKNNFAGEMAQALTYEKFLER
ncbi:MAG: hypothetical protein QOD40_3260 [Alphaproteobacteria bacterium]|nr:hypothetical protein [Alphaproteobacteria bacterium]